MSAAESKVRASRGAVECGSRVLCMVMPEARPALTVKAELEEAPPVGRGSAAAVVPEAAPAAAAPGASIAGSTVPSSMML